MTLNCQSIRNKTTDVLNFLTDIHSDIVCLQETWLNKHDKSILAEIKSNYNFKILKAFRHTKTNGGGLLVLYEMNMKAKKILLKDHTKFITFELLMCELTCIKYEKFIIVNIYRLPYSSKPKVTPKMFLEEFEILVESLISTSSKFVLVGDFNLHVNNPADYYVSEFLQLLSTYNLTQLTKQPTHVKGNCLDLVITEVGCDETYVKNVEVDFSFCTDHYSDGGTILKVGGPKVYPVFSPTAHHAQL